MMCLRCEVTRAKVIAAGMLLVGKTPEDIAKHLSERYGAAYYVDNGSVYREYTAANIKIT